jgi:uncharacterized protein YneF (UPF0154 family)
MIKELFQFGKADALMWAGVGIFSLILIIAFAIFSSSEGLLLKDLFGLAIVLILPGYVIVKLYLDKVQISENLTQNPDVNQAIDKLIMSIGISVACIIPLNFVWNYLLTMGGGEEGSTQGGGNLWGNVDEELIYTGSASWRALFTVILVVGVAIGVKIYQLRFKNRRDHVETGQ